MTLQELKEEYKKYKPSMTVIKECSDLNLYALDIIEIINDSLKEYKKELKENKKMQKSAKIRNLFPFIFQEEVSGFYDKDNELIIEIAKEMQRQIERINIIIDKISDNDKYELLKLLEFISAYYSNNIDYLEKEREVLEFNIQNIYLSNDKDDTRKVLDEFFNEKINMFNRNTNNIEKSKKI
jgi:hypothetical protein